MTRPFKVLALCVAVALAVAGCGSAAGSAGSASPLSTALSYFPAGSPFVLTLATDPNSSAVRGLRALEASVPTAALGIAAAQSRLNQLGLDYDTDLRPLLGNPIVIGTTATGAGAHRSNLLAAWVTRSASALDRVVHKLPGVRSAGSHGGASLYTANGSTAVAVEGPTVLLAGSVAELESALDHRSAHPAAHAAGGNGAALLSAFGDLTGVVKGSASRPVPWVMALQRYLGTLSASGSGVALDFRLDTSGQPLTPAQLPLAPSGGTPAFAGTLPIEVSVLDPAHLFAFAEQAGQRVTTRLKPLLALATGDLIASSDTHTSLVRVGVSNPAAAARELAHIGTPVGRGFYTLTDGGQRITAGLASGQLVLGMLQGNGTPPAPAALSAFAAAPTTPATGARGTLAFRISLPALIGLGVHGVPPGLLSGMLQRLGDVTGWAANSPAALTVHAALSVH